MAPVAGQGFSSNQLITPTSTTLPEAINILYRDGQRSLPKLM